MSLCTTKQSVLQVATHQQELTFDSASKAVFANLSAAQIKCVHQCSDLHAELWVLGPSYAGL